MLMSEETPDGTELLLAKSDVCELLGMGCSLIEIPECVSIDIPDECVVISMGIPDASTPGNGCSTATSPSCPIPDCCS